jgi:ABC-type glycerol-3-phosphate transport system substrate-binding protein
MLAAACSAPAAPSAPAATSAPAKPAESKPAEAAKPAAPAAATTAPATGPSASGKPQYKLDLGGYTGPAPTNSEIKLRFVRQTYPPASDQYFKDRYAEWIAAYPNIAVEEEVIPYGDLNQKLQTTVAAGDPPDIIMGKGDFTSSYAFNKVVVDLSQYLSKDFLDDLAPAIKSQHIVDGKLYAWPWEQAQVMFYFNKDMFKKAGVQTPPETASIADAWTWEQAMEAWEKVLAGNNTGGGEPTTYALASSTYGNGGPGSSWWLEGQYVRSLGDPNAPKDSSAYKTFAGISEDGLKASGYVDTPEAIKGMTYYQEIFKKKLSPTTPVPNQYEDGKAAGRFGSISTAIRFSTQTKPAFEWGVSSVPKGKFVFNHISGDAPIILAKTKYPAEAAAFMAYHHNDTNRIAWHKAWGATPTRLSLFGKIGYDETWQKLALDLTKAGHAPPITAGYLEYFSAINAAVKDIALGASPADRLPKVAKEIDGLLAPYKK